MPQAQAIESWSPMAPSALVTTCATTPVPNKIRIMVPRNSATSSPRYEFFVIEVLLVYPRPSAGGVGTLGTPGAPVNAARSALSNPRMGQRHIRTGYCRCVPGSIQSIERAAAVLRLLGSTDRPLGLGEIAAALDLPRPTAHGIVRTLREVGFVEQRTDSTRYVLGPGLHELGRGGWDPHDLRAHAMNWADSLASSTGLAVQLGVVGEGVVKLVHHVFRPDVSPQRIRTGESQPLHATALGKCLLAFAPVATPPV